MKLWTEPATVRGLAEVVGPGTSITLCCWYDMIEIDDAAEVAVPAGSKAITASELVPFALTVEFV